MLEPDALKVILFDDLRKDCKKTFIGLLIWLGLVSSEEFEPVIFSRTSVSIARHVVNHFRFKAFIDGIWLALLDGFKRFC